MDVHKVCGRCNRSLDRSKFGKNAASKDGLKWECKECDSEAQRVRLEARKSRSPEQVNADRVRLRPDGLKKCFKCHEVKPLDKFGKSMSQADGLASRCRECTKEYSQKFGKRDASVKLNRLKSRTSSEIEEDRVRLHPTGYKECVDCGVSKTLNEFYKGVHFADGLQKNCKPCSVVKVMRNRGVARKSLVGELKRLYGETCLFPGCDEVDNLHIDHVLPKSHGGDDHIDNYQLLCEHHNCSKGATHVDYRVKQ